MKEHIEGPVQCSLCRKDLLGRSVGLFDLFDAGVDWDSSGLGLYTSDNGEKHVFVLLHETCFTDLIHELSKQELSTILALSIGTIEDIRAGMEM